MNAIQQETSKVIKGLSLYVIASFAAAIFAVISGFMVGATILSAAGGGGGGAAFGTIIMWLLTCAANVCVIIGLLRYLKGLKGMVPHFDAVGASSIKNIANATLLLIINAIIGIIAIFVPLVFAIPMMIISIIAFILNLMGYSSFAKSTTLNEMGKAGAKKLFLAFIFAIVSALLGWIPSIGDVISLVLDILYFVFLFQGWGLIKKSFDE